MSDIFYRITTAVEQLLAVENSHGSDPGEVAATIASIACSVAKNSNVGGGALAVLACNVPFAEPDEEKAVAAVREAYAKCRKSDATICS